MGPTKKTVDICSAFEYNIRVVHDFPIRVGRVGNHLLPFKVVPSGEHGHNDERKPSVPDDPVCPAKSAQSLRSAKFRYFNMRGGTMLRLQPLGVRSRGWTIWESGRFDGGPLGPMVLFCIQHDPAFGKVDTSFYRVSIPSPVWDSRTPRERVKLLWDIIPRTFKKRMWDIWDELGVLGDEDYPGKGPTKQELEALKAVTLVSSDYDGTVRRGGIHVSGRATLGGWLAEVTQNG